MANSVWRTVKRATHHSFGIERTFGMRCSVSMLGHMENNVLCSRGYVDKRVVRVDVDENIERPGPLHVEVVMVSNSLVFHVSNKLYCPNEYNRIM